MHMALDLAIPVRYIIKVIYRCCVAVERTAHKTPYAEGGLSRPGEADWVNIAARCKDVGQYGLENYCLAMDGMVFRIGAPPKTQQNALKGTLWNSHYSCWGYTVLDVCDLFGFGVLVSQPLKMSESAAVGNAGVRLWLQETQAILKGDFGVLTDSLYAINLKDSPKEDRVHHMYSIGPRTLARLKFLAFDATATIPDDIRKSALQALYTTRYVGKLRAVVENRNRQLRCWAVVGGGTVFRSKLFRKKGVGKYAPLPEHAMAAVSFFLNRRLAMVKALRAPDWRPSPLLWRDAAPPAGFKCFYPDFESGKEMVNKSLLQSAIQKQATKFGYKSKRAKKEADDESITDIDNWSELDGVEMIEKNGMMYSNVGKSADVVLSWRQLQRLEGASNSKATFRDAAAGLEEAEQAKKRRKRKSK